MTETSTPQVDSADTVLQLGGLIVRSVSVGEYANNVYLLECTATGERLLIDAAAEPDTLLALIGDGGLAQIFTTHFHYDHWGALQQVVDATGARTAAHPADAPGIPVPTQVQVRDGEEIRVGDAVLRAVHLIGHTAGSLALVYAEPHGPHHIWSGDALFPGGVGRTHDEPALFDLLYRDVVAKIFDLYSDDTAVYPGHGNFTTVGAERPQLEEWRARGW
ncbi:MBL fold metallo-hydrolase [Nocardia jiangxiensis]|uniref:MBL fold metallo-hydrolase n=1 Tax=Nocardia jiangxiensis TaxID=282685 RepID=A0ABW6S0S9_9NOCA